MNGVFGSTICEICGHHRRAPGHANCSRLSLKERNRLEREFPNMDEQEVRVRIHERVKELLGVTQ